MRQALREAIGIALSASVLGIGYTALTERGLFAESSPSRVRQPLNTSPSLMINLAAAKEFFESGDAIFIDSRHAFDYRMGHIKDAINVPLAEVEEQDELLSGLPPEKTLVVYCDGADCNSSLELATHLLAKGFSNVKVFFGGWNEWQSTGLPSETPAP
ncbi:MAG: rhodanese-like domain-containing protein [Ignavibacteriales bacterium]|nr:rhodanese-like domain-containing protein [Ignavibacteriales bacterium]